MPRANLASQAPPFDLRLPDWYVAAMCGCWVLEFTPLLLLCILLPALLRGFSMWFMLVLAPCHLAALLVGIMARRRLRRQVAVMSGEGKLPCLSCHYGLEGLEPTSACPECGRLYDLADVAEAWRRLRTAMKLESPALTGAAEIKTAPAAPPGAAAPTPDP